MNKGCAQPYGEPEFYNQDVEWRPVCGVNGVLCPACETRSKVMSEVKTWIQWRYEDHCRADDKFVREADHLAAMEALREAKDREIEGWKTLFGTAILYLKTTQGHEIAAEGFLEEYRKLEGRKE